MNKQLQTYFENVIELEKNAYLQEQTIQGLNQKINRLGNEKYITRTELTRQADWMLNILLIGYIAVPIGAVVFGVKGLFSDFLSGALSGILKGGLIGLVVAVVVGVIKYLIDNAKENRIQASWDSRYNKEVAADDRRVAAEREQRSRLITLRDKMIAQNHKTQDTLAQYYSIGVIYPKYHNMNAMCSFYEYLMSGRCTELTGHEGGYNLYESEVRQNLIISKLDNILESLDQIKSNQYTLYSAIKEGNRKMDNLIADSERQTRLATFAAEQAAITAYNTAETANEIKQLKWLKTYELTVKGY